MDIVELKAYYKDTVWAGKKLLALKPDCSLPRLAESWELSFLEKGPSLIASGPDAGKRLMDVASKEDLGADLTPFHEFPVLIKLIDAAENLSVQVHPSDAYAKEHESSLGKEEMWHILSHDPGCGIYIGLKEDCDTETLRKHLANGTILELLNFVEVKDGDTFFIPSGTIHAIGKGVTLIEIQESSDVTYRLYDYGRLGLDGKPRELHIQKAMDVLSTKKYVFEERKGNLIGSSKYFQTYLFECEEDETLPADPRSFKSITILDAKEGAFIGELPAKKGHTYFVPAGKEAKIKGPMRYILVRV